MSTQDCSGGLVEYNSSTRSGDVRRHPERKEEDRMGAMKEFAGVFYREGALDPKTAQLVALAAMAAAGCTS